MILTQSNGFWQRARLVGLVVFLAFVFVFGGSSRGDAFAQIIVRIAAVIFAAIGYLFVVTDSLRQVKAVLYALILLIALMMVQLIPLPPALWTSLPGRQFFVGPPELAALATGWRPLSLLPDATLNSILSLIPGFAAVIWFAVLRSSGRFWLVSWLVGFIILSGVVGILQLTGQSPWLYLYQDMSDGTAVGFFANRNHQAALLCASLPLLAVFASYREAPALPSTRTFLAALSGIIVVPLVLVTGSRTGILLLVVALSAAYMIVRRGVANGRTSTRMPAAPTLTRGQLLTVAAFAAVFLALVAVIASSKAVALQRAFAMDLEADARLRLFWPMLDLLATYFPFGTGFGSFPQIFKVFEPFSNLGPSYFNHAHNDVLELLIEGGLGGGLLLGCGVAWWVRQTLRAWQGPDGSDSGALARAGSSVTLIFGLASLTDYPLRTPICSVVFLLAFCFMCVQRRAQAGDARGQAEPMPVE